MTIVGLAKSQLVGYEYYLGLNYKFRLFMCALKLSLIRSFDIKTWKFCRPTLRTVIQVPFFFALI